ncbi:MAG: lipid-A-disaccharide synthase N-terminal domain-containing protein [Sedimentisphaerales bacterium]|jgi:lipid-A-disaccharide synthase-like uncharacterized protein
MLQLIVEFFRSTITEQVAGHPVWFIIGFAGQVVFGARFILQWIVSEYKKRSQVPVAFWYISIIGSVILLIYSIHRRDLIFMLGLSLNTLIYVRNLHLIHKHGTKDPTGCLG